MPRGVKKTINFDVELARVEEQINKHADSLAKLKAEKKALQEKKDFADLKALQDLISKEGKSVADIVEIVKNTGN